GDCGRKPGGRNGSGDLWSLQADSDEATHGCWGLDGDGGSLGLRFHLLCFSRPHKLDISDYWPVRANFAGKLVDFSGWRPAGSLAAAVGVTFRSVVLFWFRLGARCDAHYLGTFAF